jgi:hypothetical protein
VEKNKDQKMQEEILKEKRREMQDQKKQEASKGRWVNSWNDKSNLHQYLLFQPEAKQCTDISATELQIRLVHGAVIRVPLEPGRGEETKITASSTVEDLKRAIHERGVTQEGKKAGDLWPVKDQSLKYNGAEPELSDKRTLTSYGVTIPAAGKFLLSKKIGIVDSVKATGARTDNVDLAFTLLWDTADDLDIHVEAPGGFEISWKSRQSPCGGKLDVDMNNDRKNAFFVHQGKKRGFQNGEENPNLKCAVENVYWARGTAPSGRYKCSVQNMHYAKEENGGSPKGAPIPFRLQIKIDDERIEIDDERFIFVKQHEGGYWEAGRQQPQWTVRDIQTISGETNFSDTLVFEFDYKVQQHYKIVSNSPVDVWSAPRLHGDRKTTSPPVKMQQQLQKGQLFKVTNRKRYVTRQFPAMKYGRHVQRQFTGIEKSFDYDKRVDKVYEPGDRVLMRDQPTSQEPRPQWRKGTVHEIGQKILYKHPKTGIDTVLTTREGFVLRNHAPFHDNSEAKYEIMLDQHTIARKLVGSNCVRHGKWCRQHEGRDCPEKGDQMWLELETGGWVAEYPVSDIVQSSFKPVCKMLDPRKAKAEEMAKERASTSMKAEGGGLSFLAIDPEVMKGGMDPRLRTVLEYNGFNIGEDLKGAENDKVCDSHEI